MTDQAILGDGLAEDADGAGDRRLPLGPDLAGSVNYRIRMAQILAFRHYEKRLTGYGGAARYLGLLSIIGETPGEAQHRLAEAVGLQRSSVVPILDRMEAEGIVERRDADGDRRTKAVFLTATGQTAVRELIGPAVDLETAMLDGLSAAEVEELRRALDVICDNLSRM